MSNPSADRSALSGEPLPPKLPNSATVPPAQVSDTVALKRLAAFDLGSEACDSAVDDLLNFNAEGLSNKLLPDSAKKLGIPSGTGTGVPSPASSGPTPASDRASAPRTLAEADAEAARMTRPVVPLPRQAIPPAGTASRLTGRTPDTTPAVAHGLAASAPPVYTVGGTAGVPGRGALGVPQPAGLGDIDTSTSTVCIPSSGGPKTQAHRVGMTAGTQILREVSAADPSVGGPGSVVPLGNAVHGESRLSMEISAVTPPAGFDSGSRVLSTTGATASGTNSLAGSMAGHPHGSEGGTLGNSLGATGNGETASSQPEALVGQTLGDYRLEKLAGSGGMATVYKAVDTRIGRVTAVKVLLAELAARDPAAHGRLMREAKTSATVAHPNVVTLFQVGRDKNRDYLVMEWVGGGSVQELVAP